MNVQTKFLRPSALTVALCLLAAAGHAGAANPSTSQVVVSTTATVLKPAPVLRPPSVATTDLSRVSPPLTGRWSSSDTDKETGVTETLVIEFKADGSYSTQLQENKFKSPRFSGSGRYTVVDADKSGFTLVVRRQMDDPESDKSNASETQRITWVDKDTLRAADGSVIRRAR